MGDDAVAWVGLALARAGHPDTILAYPTLPLPFVAAHP